MSATNDGAADDASNITLLLFGLLFGWMILIHPCGPGGCISARKFAYGLASLLFWTIVLVGGVNLLL